MDIMSKEKTPDDKLREAAANRKLRYSALEKYPGHTKELQIYMAGAKSKESAEYHQSLQPVVDVKALREEFYEYHFVRKLTVSDIFGWFLPHLKQGAPESDAVNFHEWMNTEGWILTDFENMLYLKIPADVIEYEKSEMKSGNQLYAEYKQYKTNRDEPNTTPKS